MESFLKKFKEPRFILQILIVALVYFASAKFGLSLAYSYKQVTLVWPPTGISLAVLLLFGFRFWPGIFIGAFLANISTMEPFVTAFGIAVGNTLEAVVGAYLLVKFGFHKSFARFYDVAVFVIFAAVFSTIISATIGTASLIFGGIGSWREYFLVWQNWFAGDFIGNMLIAPVILVWSQIDKSKFKLIRLIEAFVLIAALAYTSLVIFTNSINLISPEYQNQFKYLIFPFLLWFSYRFRQKGSTLAVLVVTAIGVWGAINNAGPFVVEGDPEKTLLFLSSFAGAISLTFLVFSSIVEGKENAEGKIERSEKRFRALIENSYDAIVLVDPTGVIKYASPSTKRVWGYEPEEVVGMNGFKLIHKDDIKPSLKVLSKIILSPGKSLTIENRIIRKDGKVRWMDATGTNLLMDSDIGAVVINFRDVTERKKLDEAKSEFVSLSAHQLRSPLSIIRWYSESLLKEKSLSKKLKDDVNEVHTATLNMNEIVSLLLEISKFESDAVKISTSKINLESIVKEVLKDKENEIKDRKFNLIEKYDQSLTEITDDPKLVKVIVENLVSNSIKYTKDGGKINIALKENGDNVLLTVKDTGIGIPVEDQEKIFTKLFRGSNVKSVDKNGLGLGLYLLRLVIDLKGGKIWFESEEGKGTSFFVEFPKKTNK